MFVRNRLDLRRGIKNKVSKLSIFLVVTGFAILLTVLENANGQFFKKLTLVIPF
jgi:hypothetical protein